MTTMTDERAKLICQDAVDGTLEDAEARRQLWTLVARRTVEQVAKSTCSNPATAERVADRLEIVVTTALLEGVYDFERGLGSSFDGWVRKYAGAALLSAVRDTLREERRNGMPEDFKPWQEYRPVWQAGTTDSDEVFDAYCAAKGNLRPARKLQLDAMTLRSLYQLPAPGRPHSRDERAALLALLEGDSTAAITSLRGWLARTGGPTDVLWDEFHPEHVQVFLEECDMSADVLTTIARAAVADYPRPSRKRLTEMRKRVTDSLGDASLARRLVDSWVEVEATGNMDHLPQRDAREDQAKGAILQRQRFDTDLAAAAKVTNSTPEHVHDMLRAVGEEIDLFSIRFQG